MLPFGRIVKDFITLLLHLLIRSARCCKCGNPRFDCPSLQGLFDKLQVLETARTAGGGLRVRWSAKPLRVYQLLATSDLKAGTWTPIGARVGDAVTGSRWWYAAEIPAAELVARKQIYLRVQEIQP